MSSTEPAPETRMMPGDELSADDAFLALRHYGRWPLVRDAFVRFRYARLTWDFVRWPVSLALIVVAIGVLFRHAPLLLWANLTGIAFFLGLAFAAQLEAQRVGVVRLAVPTAGSPVPSPRPTCRTNGAPV